MAAEIDRLLEEGLTLYGHGDLDGALLAWERALSIDPDNAQANSYVDYVRQNYDLLSGEATTSDEGVAPYGIEDEPYQLEVFPSEAVHLKTPATAMTEIDEGWGIEDETEDGETADRAETTDGAPPEFAEPELTPGVDFANQATNLRERDTGFVKPVAAKPAEPGGKPASSASAMPRSDTGDPFAGMALPTDHDIPPASANISLSYDDPPTAERQLSAAAQDLINSLPTPAGRAHSPTSPPRTDTADLPPAVRPPAVPPTAPSMSATITQDFETQQTNAANPRLPVAGAPTQELAPGQIPDFMVSAPTRDLGLRPPGTKPLMPTSEENTAHLRMVPKRPDGVEETRHDVILPFDPIDARTAQILDEIDEDEPANETKEDKTRRRITTLFERATAWSQAGELDRAVAAIDLALSEDPNSALGQKLVHRHRDTMMQVFQAFLGDLDRQPILARPLHELATAPISPRAAFLLSRIDGTLTMDELLDVSGMPRIEAYRYLCQLFLRGILR